MCCINYSIYILTFAYMRTYFFSSFCLDQNLHFNFTKFLTLNFLYFRRRRKIGENRLKNGRLRFHFGLWRLIDWNNFWWSCQPLFVPFFLFSIFTCFIFIISISSYIFVYFSVRSLTSKSQQRGERGGSYIQKMALLKP